MCNSLDNVLTQVHLVTLVDFATEVWRIERWLAKGIAAQSAMPLQYALRRLVTIVHELELETVDMTGMPYDPGLALEVIACVDDASLPGGEVVIDEVVLPLCLWQGRVVRHGQVVTKSSRGERCPGGSK